MNFRIIMKNRAGDLEIGFLTKSILKSYGRATAIPTAWELSFSGVPKKISYHFKVFCILDKSDLFLNSDAENGPSAADKPSKKRQQNKPLNNHVNY